MVRAVSPTWQHVSTSEGHLQTSSTYLLTYSMQQSPSWEANWFCS